MLFKKGFLTLACLLNVPDEDNFFSLPVDDNLINSDNLRYDYAKVAHALISTRENALTPDPARGIMPPDTHTVQVSAWSYIDDGNMS